MMNLNDEADGWPSGITIEGYDLSNNVLVNDPLLMRHSFQAPDRGINQLRKCTINNKNGNFAGSLENQVVSNMPSTEPLVSISNSKGNFFGFREPHAISNHPSMNMSESISNNNNGNFVEFGGTQAVSNLLSKEPSASISNNNGKKFGFRETNTISNPPSINMNQTINNNNRNFVEFGGNQAVSNLPSIDTSEPITNNDENLVGGERTHPTHPQPDPCPDDPVSDPVFEPVRKPYIGMWFDTIEASHTYWDRYAHATGFRARIRATSRRKRDGVIRSRTYVCAKEGTRGEDPRRVVSKRRPETRCGCGATMMVSLVKGTGIYRVVNFVEEHNHGLDGVRAHLSNSVNGQISCKPVIGMEFDSVEASGAFWEQYAHNAGFGARIRATSKRKNDGVIRTRTYVCSREGKKFIDPRNLNSKPRSDSRCGCGVLMTISLVKEKWIYRVVAFVEEHNHGLDGKKSISRPKAPVENCVVEKVSLSNMNNTRENEAPARVTSVSNGAGNLVLEGPLFNLTNAQRMGILCTEFMQLAYRAVGSNEVFEGVRRLIKDGHSLADKY